MKEIKLSQNKVALVDDEDYEYLNQFKWYAHKNHRTFYAIRKTRKNEIGGRGKLVWMHRVIMNTPIRLQSDHIDHNGLNNQKYNLRNCTNSQNQLNSKPQTGKKYKGVILFEKKYIGAQICIKGKHKYLGIFDTKEAAAEAYNKEAKIHHGEFAYFNKLIKS